MNAKRRIACSTVALLMLGGCSSQPIIPGLSTAASMRVEVELYKGPLSKTLAVQAGELLGTILEARATLSEVTVAGIRYHHRACGGDGAGDPIDCSTLHTANVGACDLLTLLPADSSAATRYLGVDAACMSLGASVPTLAEPADTGAGQGKPPAVAPIRVPALGAAEAPTAVSPAAGRGARLPYAERVTSAIDPKLVENLEKLVLEGDETGMKREALRHGLVSMRTKLKGFIEVFTTIPRDISDVSMRRILVDYSTLYAEFSNQLNARTDVLLKQLSESNQKKSLPGRSLPISDHLRDASPTDFINLYQWYETAHGPRGGRLSVDDKVRMAQRVFSDHYWTKINEVHANGQGEVRMAFVKNDIGNWDLKSFDNNPEELLNAYRDMTLAGIKAATNAVSSGGTGAIQPLVARLTRGNVGIGAQEGGVSPGAGSVEKARRRVIDDLRELSTRVEGERKRRADTLAGVTAGAQSANVDVDKASDDVDLTDGTIRATQANIITLSASPAPDGSPNPGLQPEIDKLAGLHDTREAQLAVLESARRTLADKQALVAAEEANLRQWADGAIREARRILAQHRRVLEVLQDVSSGQ